MTQAVLAGLAGVSQSYISKVEAGHKGIERRSTLVAIAGALHVSVADLLGEPGDPTDPHKASATAAVPAIRVALLEIEEGERRPPRRGQDELSAALDHVVALRLRGDPRPIAELLPGLLVEAAAHGGLLLARAGFETSTCLKNLDYRDLALPAARLGLRGAQDIEHAAWIGATRYACTLAMP